MAAQPPVHDPVPADARWSLTDSFHQTYLRITGTPIEYDLRPYRETLAQIEAIPLAKTTDTDLRARLERTRERAAAGEALDPLLPEVFAIVRDACVRVLAMRPFDVQVLAAIALHQGKLAQLATGEGKTLVAVLPMILNALPGRGAHVFTANDYLARRDAEWMGPVYDSLGLTVGVVQRDSTHDERRRAYAADVTYVTAQEAGFDLLRDYTATDRRHLVQRAFQYVIVDEADFILIDEARVPLVIAGERDSPAIDPVAIASVVRQLRAGVDYSVDEYARNVALTDEGFQHTQRRLSCAPLHLPAQRVLLSAVHVALHAQALLHRDRDYIVRGNRVELVDEFTGRVAENRRWPHGIQPAVEAKEGVDVRREGQILGSIPIQHFVKLYPRIAGMTATAVLSAQEFMTFYGMTTVVFPPHAPCRRADEDDVVFANRAAKLAAVLDEVARVHATGRPILIGTASVHESEALAAALSSNRLASRVLNARHDAQEAAIVARAGEIGAITISTNMAGRGTDIVLGGVAATGTEGGPTLNRQRVVDLGGLYVIGTNRHESRRVDDQLRGRAGRQGDPGTSRFYVSLEDDLIQRYGVMTLIPSRHHPKPGPEPVDDPIVHREIARAQRIIEGQNFEIRKTLWQYSALVDAQRRAVYRQRQAWLLDETDASVCAVGARVHYTRLVREAGAEAVHHAERQLAMHVLDRHWSDHLGLVDDIREGIHLQRYGGREPVQEFHKQIVEAFDAMFSAVDDEVVERFCRLTADRGSIDLAAAGIHAPSSTWTYLVNDNPFSSFGIALIAGRNIGLSAAFGLMAAIYWPVTFAVTATMFLRRWSRRTRRS